MKQSVISLIFYGIISLLNFDIVYAGSKIAVSTKVKGTVEVRPNRNDVYQKLKTGKILENKDQIKTGNNGFTAIIFIDDKSTLKIKENSEVEITGKRTRAKISKEIFMDIGTLRATVGKQRQGEFVIQTPTSVASVKGTDFWLSTDPIEGDLLITLDGVVSFTNSITGESISVTGGNTGLSLPNGDLSIATTDPATIPEDPSEAEEETENELRIYFEGPDGEEKSILIRY